MSIVCYKNSKLGVVTMANKEEDFNPWGSKYTESMCAEIIEMFSKGKTQANFCAKHTIGTDTFDKWRKRHKLFNAACIAAQIKARDYYDNLRQQYLVEEFEGAKINWGLFNKMYAARFNIADKRAVRIKGLGKSKNEREMLQCLTKAIEAQELTPDEAQKLSGIIEVSLKIKETQELEERLKVLEQAEKLGTKDKDFK